MASRGKKKMVSKDDLRRMMKQHAGESKATKKIDSPLAKYNTLDQLVCIVCNTHIKSELLWNAHLLGRTHKENVIKLKKVQQQQTGQTVSRIPGGILKRKANETSVVATKIQRNNGDPSKTTNVLSIGNYSSSSSEDEEEKSAPQVASTSALPSDFFDQNVVGTKSKNKKEEPKELNMEPKTMSEQLPEGFFDDPRQDAKVRQIEYKDKMDEEWELFQRSMKEETNVSEQIREEDEAQATVERNIDEIDEQIHCWSKVNELQEKKEKLMQNVAETDMNAQSGSEAEDDDFDEFLNWRAKSAWN